MTWWLWVLVGVVALGGEAASMALFLLNVAVAAFVVAALVLLGVLSAPVQAVVFIVLSVLLIGLIRPRLLAALTRHDQGRPTIEQGAALVDRFATVTDPVTCDGGMIQVGKAEFWTARVSSPTERIPIGSRVRIAAVRGLTAYVEPLRLPETPDPAPIAFAVPAQPLETPVPAQSLETLSCDPPSAVPSPPTFGALLKRYRLAAGLTQEELAERARLSVRAISDLERGLHRAPQKETVALLADALTVTPAERAALEAARRTGSRGGTEAGRSEARP